MLNTILKARLLSLSVSPLFLSTICLHSTNYISEGFYKLVCIHPNYMRRLHFLVAARAMLAKGADRKVRDKEGKDGEEKQSTQAVAGEDEEALEPLVLHLGKHSVKVELRALLVDPVEAVKEAGHARADCCDVLLHLAHALEFVGDDEEGGNGGSNGDGGGAPGEGAGEQGGLGDGCEDDALKHCVNTGDLVGLGADCAKLVFVVCLERVKGLEVSLPCLHLLIVGGTLMQAHQYLFLPHDP
ncbi:hypothetical protein GOP47_0012932 [Adiantum capillus-veneris]|uniref:Uncharacterized protein n=1 Tax=Adiantum capillus-veneris TaxID=13818 RepID=A0A9D4US67_ADICA|nr:hypothetical protein GOP47_0012932 [Adiantum capillus-veneris]